MIYFASASGWSPSGPDKTVYTIRLSTFRNVGLFVLERICLGSAPEPASKTAPECRPLMRAIVAALVMVSGRCLGCSLDTEFETDIL
jgi:hypothetical protein